ncbi:hypothetical protein ACJO2E_05925 [Marinobacter sp. M1N3S26]|uniref:hypothetical protein n=1 Tax=Marinobacter sp. M1N3S26 TaxID=3382299 RepID=UPI00387ADEAF
MNTAITLRKLAVITAGLVLGATASMGHAQQKWMEEVLERQFQEQQLAGEKASDNTDQRHNKNDAENPEKKAPKDIDVSNTYDDEGNPII